MNIVQFYEKYAEMSRPIDDLLDVWNKIEVEKNLDLLADVGLLTTDGAIGDGLTDRVPQELRYAMEEVLKNQDIHSYGTAREYLREVLTKDEKVRNGFVNKVKGQVGENRVLEVCGDKARLAPSGNQEGWDLAHTIDGETTYIQVKMYKDADAVIKKMREVQEKIQSGKIMDGTNIVPSIDFAVPDNIADEVKKKALQNPEIAGIEIIPVDMTSTQSADIVQAGLDNHGEEASSHLISEFIQGASGALAIHATINLVSAFRKKTSIGESIENIIGSTALSSSGYLAGFMAETSLDNVLDIMLAPASVGIGISTRVLLKKSIKAKYSTYDKFKINNDVIRQNIIRLENLTPVISISDTA